MGDEFHYENYDFHYEDDEIFLLFLKAHYGSIVGIVGQQKIY